jgi:short chain dehydrogenase
MHVDGNAIGGLLTEVFAAEMASTSAASPRCKYLLLTICPDDVRARPGRNATHEQAAPTPRLHAAHRKENRMSMNWLEGMPPHMADPMTEPMDRAMALPVFAGQKLVVVGGSSGMGRQTAIDVVAAGGSAVVIGLDDERVNDTVAELSRNGKAFGIAADLTDRMQVERVRQQLADEHADATLLVNAAGLFIPKPFLDLDGDEYDSYLELDRAIFFITQTVARGMVSKGRGGSIVTIGSMWAHQAIGATPSSAYSLRQSAPGSTVKTAPQPARRPLPAHRCPTGRTYNQTIFAHPAERSGQALL